MIEFSIICKELHLVIYDTGKVIYEEKVQDRSKYCVLGLPAMTGYHQSPHVVVR